MADLYTRSYNPIWDFRSLTGLPLDDTSWAWFLENTIPYVPQAVYHTGTGTPWSNPVQLSAAGTLQDIFFDPNLVYRIEIRTNLGNLTAPSQSDPLVWLVENYIPGGSGGITPPITSGNLSSSNQITNPQFALINFNSPLVITVAGTYSIAPGWDLVLGGAGNATITLLPINSVIPTNAPYVLELNLSGWTTQYLVQKFLQDGMLWAGKFVTTSITARINGISKPLIGTLNDQSGNLISTLYNIPLVSTYFSYNRNTAAALPASTNVSVPPNASVEYRITLPDNSDVSLTSIQILATDTAVSLTYEQDTTARQIDHTFHNYKESILTQEKESILTGWDFPLNPWQFRATTSTNVAGNGEYTADQTIVLTEEADSVTTSRGTTLPIGTFQVASIIGQPQGKIAIVQYIDPKTCANQWQEVLSALLQIKFTTSQSTQVRVKIKLIQSGTLPITLSPISAWNADNVDPTFTAQWTNVLSPVSISVNDPAYLLTSAMQELAFNSFTALANQTLSTATLGIVIYTTSALSTVAVDTISIKNVSLVQNDVAIKTNSLSYDETLRRCQFYYEKSYRNGVLPGAVTYIGSISGVAFSDATASFFEPFNFYYKSTKRTIPIITFYDVIDGTINQFRIIGSGSNVIVGTAAVPQADAVFIPTSTAGIDNAQYILRDTAVAYPGIAAAFAFTNIQYTLDARLFNVV